jgi:hypothetical protein
LGGVARAFQGFVWHAGFPSGRLISSNVGTWVVPNQDSSVARRLYRMRDQCAVSKTLFQCGCTRRRNRRRLSPFSGYVPTASRIKPESNALFKGAHYPMSRLLSRVRFCYLYAA